VDLLAEFGRKATEIKNIQRESHLHEHGFGQFDQPPAFRHFARTGMFVARGAVDQQHAWDSIGVVVTLLRGDDGLTRREPVDRNVVIRIGEAGAGLACQRRFSRVAVAIPCGADKGCDFPLQRREGWIGEAAAKTVFEFVAR
jgi:hypothetical protein